MATPTYISEIPPGTDVSVLRRGAEVLDFEVYEHNELLAGVLEALREDGRPLYRHVVVLQPRRSAKTTGIWETLIGRCLERPGTVVLATAQDGTRARDRLKDQMRRLRGRGFRDATQPDENGEPVLGLLYWGNGDERIEFTNGSRIITRPPVASAIRGEAADVLFFDEAGELDIAKSADLLSGALPLLDTRRMGQAIIAGTPATERAGLFWDKLQQAREGKRRVGILDYSIRDDESSTVPVDPDDPDSEHVLNEEVLLRVHPGIGTLTDLEDMVDNFEQMQLAQFEREYLCRFPFSSASHAIDPERWKDARTEPLDRPEKLGIAFDVRRDGTSAAVAYAWRLDDGTAVLDVVDHQPGASWVPNTTHRCTVLHRNCKVGYDNIGANLEPADTLSRMKPKPRTTPLSMKEAVAAQQRVAELVRDGRLLHFGQSDLDAAVENAGWRPAGQGQAFGTRDPLGAAINPLAAAALALWMFDKTVKGSVALPRA